MAIQNTIEPMFKVESPSRSVKCNTTLAAGWWAKKLKRAKKPLRIYYYGVELKDFSITDSDGEIASSIRNEIHSRGLTPQSAAELNVYKQPRKRKRLKLATDHVPLAVRKLMERD